MLRDKQHSFYYVDGDQLDLMYGQKLFLEEISARKTFQKSKKSPWILPPYENCTWIAAPFKKFSLE